jgi:hypothetical protein
MQQQPKPSEDDDVIPLGLEDDEIEDGEAYEDAPGPDERDMDLMDGTWEQKYYGNRSGGRDWNTIGLAIAILVILAMVLPGVLVVLN